MYLKDIWEFLRDNCCVNTLILINSNSGYIEDPNLEAAKQSGIKVILIH